MDATKFTDKQLKELATGQMYDVLTAIRSKDIYERLNSALAEVNGRRDCFGCPYYAQLRAKLQPLLEQRPNDIFYLVVGHVLSIGRCSYLYAYEILDEADMRVNCPHVNNIIIPPRLIWGNEVIGDSYLVELNIPNLRIVSRERIAIYKEWAHAGIIKEPAARK